jgi:GTP-binding protein EngB required for normal cell division
MKTITAQQTEYLELCSTLNPLTKEYQVSSEELGIWQKEIGSFQAYVPLIGAYSSGKSSLLNAFLQQKLFRVKIDPCTDIAFEIFWANQDKFEIITDGKSSSVTAEQIREGTYAAKPESICRVALNNPALQSLPHLAIVDLPGLQSGVRVHSMAIDNYISKSAAYLLIIDPEILLREDLIRFMEELQAFTVPVYCLITKSDKIDPTDMEQVKEAVQEQILQYFGRKPDGIDTVSAGIPDTEGFKRVLNELENRSGELLATAYNGRFRSLLNTLERSINTRIENTELDDTELDRKERELVNKIEAAKHEIAGASEKSRVEAQNAGARWIAHIQQALESNVNALVNTQMAGGDLQSQIGHICRRAFIDGYNQFVLPVLKGYGSKLEGIVANVQIGNSGFSKTEQTGVTNVPKQENSNISVVIEDILKTIPVIGPFLAALVALFKALFGGSKGKAASKEDQKRQIEQRLRSEIIPQVVSNLHEQIKQKIDESISEMNKNTEQALNVNLEQFVGALADLKEQRKAQADEFAKQKLQWQKDLETVRGCYGYLT